MERGTHAELVQQGGLYAEMWTRQAEAAAVEEVGKADDDEELSNGSISNPVANGSSNSLHP